MTTQQGAGPWFNIKMLSYQYRKSHCGDKTVVRSSYLHNGICYIGKATSLYWIGPQDTWVGITKPSSIAPFSHFFRIIKATGYSLNITFMFNRYQIQSLHTQRLSVNLSTSSLGAQQPNVLIDKADIPLNFQIISWRKWRKCIILFCMREFKVDLNWSHTMLPNTTTTTTMLYHTDANKGTMYSIT